MGCYCSLPSDISYQWKHTLKNRCYLPNNDSLYSRFFTCCTSEHAYWQAARMSATPPLPFWTYYMNRSHSITTPCTCVNNTSFNQLEEVPEPEIPVPRGKEWQSGVGTLELLAVCWTGRTSHKDQTYHNKSWNTWLFNWVRDFTPPTEELHSLLVVRGAVPVTLGLPLCPP